MNFNQFKKQCFVLISISALFALQSFADTDSSTNTDVLSAQDMNVSSLMPSPGGGGHGGYGGGHGGGPGGGFGGGHGGGFGGDHGGGHSGPIHPAPGGHGDYHPGHGGGHDYHPGYPPTYPGHGGDHGYYPGHHPNYPGHGFPGAGHHYDHGPWVGHGGAYPWRHWDHPVVVRPVYGWNWPVLRVVTCTAIDSYGDLFPVTEDGYFGSSYQDRIEDIQDAALDRCYDESDDQNSCRLLDCQPGY